MYSFFSFHLFKKPLKKNPLKETDFLIHYLAFQFKSKKYLHVFDFISKKKKIYLELFNLTNKNYYLMKKQ